ncbi:hypothetical protein BaRGS_00034106, partial [Batillaria attramentaria]
CFKPKPFDMEDIEGRNRMLASRREEDDRMLASLTGVKARRSYFEPELERIAASLREELDLFHESRREQQNKDAGGGRGRVFNRSPWFESGRGGHSRDDLSPGDAGTYTADNAKHSQLTVTAYGEHHQNDSGRKKAIIRLHVFDSRWQIKRFGEKLHNGGELLFKTPGDTLDDTSYNKLYVRLRTLGRYASSWTHTPTDDRNHSGEQHFDLPRDSTGRLKQPITVNWRLESVPSSNPGPLLLCAVDISQVVGDTTPHWNNNGRFEKNTRFPLEVLQRVPRNVTMIKDGLPPEKPDIGQVHSEVITMATPRAQFKKWGCHGDDPSRVRSLLPVRCGQSVGAPPCFHGNHLAVM